MNFPVHLFCLPQYLQNQEDGKGWRYALDVIRLKLEILKVKLHNLNALLTYYYHLGKIFLQNSECNIVLNALKGFRFDSV